MYVATTSAGEAREAFSVVLTLRGAGIRTEVDRTGRSLKAQFKQADKLGAKLCVVLGPDEVAAGVATLRDMTTHEQVQVPADQLVEEVRQRLA